MDDVVFLLFELLEVSAKEARAETVQCHGAYVQLSWLWDINRRKCDAAQWTLALVHVIFLVAHSLLTKVPHTFMWYSWTHFVTWQSGSYAWEAVALVHMYDNLNDASKNKTKQLVGYITLLQVIWNFIKNLFLVVFFIKNCVEFICF